MIAITERYTEAVPFLLNEGADVNYPTPDRRTALYYACFLGQQKVVEELLEAGANIEFHDADNVFFVSFTKHRYTGRHRVEMWRL
jgi:ankyrin repeat protein